jgi:soluble lytic murein transglycosylase
VVLKQQALDAAALGNTERAERLWRRLLRLTRLAAEPASADALYALGREEPALRQRLLQRWPAHPAALAAASERGDRSGALHLARWGARWPGAQRRLQTACRGPGPTANQRQQLADGLAQLGERDAARALPGGHPTLASTLLRLAETDLLAEAGITTGPWKSCSGSSTRTRQTRPPSRLCDSWAQTPVPHPMQRLGNCHARCSTRLRHRPVWLAATAGSRPP